MPNDVEIIQLVSGLFLNVFPEAVEAQVKTEVKARGQVRRGPRYLKADISKYRQSLWEFTIPTGGTDAAEAADATSTRRRRIMARAKRKRKLA